MCCLKRITKVVVTFGLKSMLRWVALLLVWKIYWAIVSRFYLNYSIRFSVLS